MVDVGVCFSWIVCIVGWAGTPEVAELALRFAAAKPPEAHVHGFHFARDDSLVGYAKGCSVIGLDGRGGLGPTHFSERVAKRDHFFGADVEAREFGLCS